MMLRVFPTLVAIFCLAPLAFGLAGVVLPALGAVPATGALRPGAGAFRLLLAEPGLGTSMGLTVLSGVGAPLLSLALSLLVVTFTRGTGWWTWIRRVLPPVLALPHVAFAVGFAFLISPSGWLVRLISPVLTGWHRPPDWQIIQDPLGLTLTLALAFKETPFLILMCMAALSQIDTDRQLRLGRSFGYPPHRVWQKLLIPQLYPLIRLPLFAAMAYSLSVVDMALLLGPNRPPTLAVKVFHWFQEPELALMPRAAAGALLLFGLTLGLMGCWMAVERLLAPLLKKNQINGRRGRPSRFLAGIARLSVPAGALVTLSVFAGLCLWSVAQRWRFPHALPSRMTLVNWTAELPFASEPMGVSLAMAAVVSATAVFLVVGCLEHQARSQRCLPLGLIALPILLPQLPMVFGIQVAALKAGLSGSLALVMWGHLLFVFPYTWLCLNGTYLAFDQRYVTAGLSMGRSPLACFFRIKLPMLLRPVLFSWAVGFSVSIAQFLPTLMLGGGRVPTITTEAVAIGSGVDRRLAAVYALIQVALPTLAYATALVIPRLKRGTP
ncbi:ABC transporter permease [Desulfoluna butyratoxydans]|uniref:Abc transporter type 1 transmembrane domain meti-like n=1 Tax=Desulfoluna butyratoxydans TaxID=231438 RepID=A0A4U8YIL6_9BACT|nr:ABC transporter permease [Desulfoluna butyratoxydans]VFQ43210.1 abc transporter type 1 transmembrane domain meti-like [Desulfoluna butyratoxydans]